LGSKSCTAFAAQAIPATISVRTAAAIACRILEFKSLSLRDGDRVAEEDVGFWNLGIGFWISGRPTSYEKVQRREHEKEQRRKGEEEIVIRRRSPFPLFPFSPFPLFPFSPLL
jgi:hypothetical protein